jgi:hypothetical protein
MRQALFAMLLAGIACQRPPAHQPLSCHPLGGAGACLLPYPSSYFQVDDPTSATGVRNAIPVAAMPTSVNHRPINPERLNRLDGYSPATPLLLLFPEGVDVSDLASVHDFSPSLRPDSPIQLFDMSSGARVDYFAELDADPTAGAGRQALIVRPQHRLSPATKYAVAVLGLKSKAGTVLTAPDAFVAARDGKLGPDSALWTMKDRYDALFAFLEKQGLKRADLTLAWDFTTASEDMITGRLVRMRDRALAAATFDYRIDSVSDITDGGPLRREVVGTFVVPSFLDSDAGTATLPRDAGADPVVIAPQPFRFVVHVPACAQSAVAPLPLMIYGHGLLNNALDELNEDYQRTTSNRLCMVQVATDWVGLSTDDLATLASAVAPDFGRFNIVTDHLMQAQINTVVLTRLARTRLINDDALKLEGRPVTDASQLYYEGISLGGIMGSTFMAIDPDIERGVTNVPGSEWNLMMTRSEDFATMQVVLDANYPDALDRQVAFAFSQSLWDETDPISYAPHLLRDPLPGVTVKKMLVQESEGDTEVPNLATRLLARTEGISALSPLVTPVPGLTEQPAPLDSAFVQFDTHPTPEPGDTNVPPQSNGAHVACRQLDVVVQQIGAFLKPDGAVQQFCSGTCDPN